MGVEGCRRRSSDCGSWTLSIPAPSSSFFSSAEYASPSAAQDGTTHMEKAGERITRQSDSNTGIDLFGSNPLSFYKQNQVMYTRGGVGSTNWGWTNKDGWNTFIVIICCTVFGLSVLIVWLLYFLGGGITKWQSAESMLLYKNPQIPHWYRISVLWSNYAWIILWSGHY